MGPDEKRTHPNLVVDTFVSGSVAGIGVLTCFLRSPYPLEHPQLWAEDGRVWFKAAYEHGWIEPLIRPQVGYLQTFSRVIADLGLTVPLLRVPLLFVIAAVIVQILPAVVLASQRFASLIPHRSIRFFAAALYLVIPNSVEVNANLTNAQWHLGLLAVLVVLATPTTIAWRVFDVVALLISGLTGPFCLALFPIVLLCLWKRRNRWCMVQLGLVGLSAIIQVIELMTSVRGRVAPLGITFKRFVDILGGQITIGSTLGTATRERIQASSDFFALSIVFLFAGAILVGSAVIFGPFELKAFNCFVGFILAGSLFSPVVSTHIPQWLELSIQGSNRYWFFPALAIFGDLLWLATRWRPPVFGALGVLLLVLVASFGIREDFRYPTRPHTNWASQVERFEKESKGHKFVFAITPARWSMTLIKH